MRQSCFTRDLEIQNNLQKTNPRTAALAADHPLVPDVPAWLTPFGSPLTPRRGPTFEAPAPAGGAPRPRPLRRRPSGLAPRVRNSHPSPRS